MSFVPHAPSSHSPMTPEHYLAAIARLDLTHTTAARLLGYQERTSERWAKGTMRVPPAVERILWLMENYPGVQVMLGRANAGLESQISWELMGGKRRFHQQDVKP